MLIPIGFVYYGILVVVVVVVVVFNVSVDVLIIVIIYFNLCLCDDVFFATVVRIPLLCLSFTCFGVVNH